MGRVRVESLYVSSTLCQAHVDDTCRESLIDVDGAAFLSRFLRTTAKRHGAEVMAMGVVADHLHLVLRLPPTSLTVLYRPLSPRTDTRPTSHRLLSLTNSLAVQPTVFSALIDALAIRLPPYYLLADPLSALSSDDR